MIIRRRPPAAGLVLLVAGALVVLAAGCDDDPSEATAPGSPPAGWPDELEFAVTPSLDGGGSVETAQPLADLLAERLGITVTAVVPPDQAGVVAALGSGRVQLAGALGPRQMVEAVEQAGAELVVQMERNGSPLYVTHWFTNEPDTYCVDEPVAEDGFLFCNGVLDAAGPQDGPIGDERLDRVAGRTVAFVDPGSTAGYAIPALQLADAGVDPIDDIDALFAGGHESSVRAVYDGHAVVGVSFTDARRALAEELPDVGREVVVFGWSGPFPHGGFAVGSELPDDLVGAISDALVDLAATDEGVAVLGELYDVDGLAPVAPSDYGVIRDLEARLDEVR